MQQKTKKTLVFVAIVALFMQTLFGSLPVMATGNLSTLHITMTTNGQPYNEGDTATSPVEVQVATTSGVSAGIEISQDARTTWQPFDHTQPLVITEEGEHELWFRLADVEERHIIKIDSRLVQPLQLMKTTAANSVIIYVDAKSNGGNGESWTTAYNNLQQALNDAKAKLQVAPTTKLEIWLAAGTYKPTERTTSNDPRTATFQMQNNVAIYGGFNGTETELTERDWENNETILSGDIDNTPTEDSKNNAYHVFYHPDGLGLDHTAILDGVTIERGYANNVFVSHTSGGGMENTHNSPTLTNVTFRNNTSGDGGGMNNEYSSPTLTNVTFSNNTVLGYGYGGGMANWSSSPKLINVKFSNNKTTLGNGGGMSNWESNPTLTNVEFSNNTANRGGGLTNENNSNPTLTNVTMSGNETKSENKGAIYDGSPQIRNSIIVGNNGEPALDNVGGTIEHSLLDVVENGEIVAKFHGDIQAETYTPEAIFMNPDQQDYRLRAGSPAIDKGDKQLNTAITDLLGNPRIQRDVIDLGAYEAFPYDVTYDANDASTGDVPLDKLTYQQGDPVIVQSNSGNLKRTGYTFAGWNTQADGQGDDYAENGTFIMGTSNQILYAKWMMNPTYTVTYDPNGATDGMVPQDNQRYEANESVKVKENSGQLVKTGYTFVGWNTQANGKGTSYKANDTFQITANSTLYAQWKDISNPPPTDGGSNPPPVSNDNDNNNGNDHSPPAKVKITLHTNGGTAIAPIDIAYNTKISDLPIPTREGYRFAGWYQDEVLTKPWAADTVLRENISLYAKWTALPVEEPQPQPEPEAPSPTVTFSDIERHWAKEMIEELASAGIIQGYEDGTFRPNESISRMHVAALLTRAFSFEQVRAGDDFKDVSSTHPYYEAIMTLQQAGIVDGTNGTFLPNEKMTRAQLAKVLVGLMGRTPEGTSSFTDVASTHWSAGYIAVLEQEGIALGDNGKFNPSAPVTRAQFVTFLYRVMQTIDS